MAQFQQCLGQQPGLGGRHRADFQFATVLGDIVTDGHAAEGFEHFPGHRQRSLPRRIEQCLTTGAVEQTDAQGLFQVANLRADRRLRQADVHARCRERAVTRHRDKGFQFAQHGGLD
ncbi:hypothetical protein D3C78_1267370 [compost metagenome]